MNNSERETDDFDREALAMTNEKTSIREKVHNAVAKCRLKIKRLLLP
jgi:hypothetical protein